MFLIEKIKARRFTLSNFTIRNLRDKSGAELAQAFAAIPAGVTSLDLGCNYLGNKSGAELAQAFAAIPAGVTSLNLWGNDLSNKSGAELAQAFAAYLLELLVLI